MHKSGSLHSAIDLNLKALGIVLYESKVLAKYSTSHYNRYTLTIFTRFFIGSGQGDGVCMVKIFEKLSVVNVEAKISDLPKEEKMNPLFFNDMYNQLRRFVGWSIMGF